MSTVALCSLGVRRADPVDAVCAHVCTCVRVCGVRVRVWCVCVVSQAKRRQEPATSWTCNPSSCTRHAQRSSAAPTTSTSSSTSSPTRTLSMHSGCLWGNRQAGFLPLLHVLSPPHTHALLFCVARFFLVNAPSCRARICSRRLVFSFLFINEVSKQSLAHAVGWCWKSQYFCAAAQRERAKNGARDLIQAFGVPQLSGTHCTNVSTTLAASSECKRQSQRRRFKYAHQRGMR